MLECETCLRSELDGVSVYFTSHGQCLCEECISIERELEGIINTLPEEERCLIEEVW